MHRLIQLSSEHNKHQRYKGLYLLQHLFLSIQNATPTLKKSIKSLDEAFSIIETCCNTSPIQDNYDFNRAKLSLNWMINILGKKYGLYVSKNAILACKNIGELKQLLYNSSNKNGNL